MRAHPSHGAELGVRQQGADLRVENHVPGVDDHLPPVAGAGGEARGGVAQLGAIQRALPVLPVAAAVLGSVVVFTASSRHQVEPLAA